MKTLARFLAVGCAAMFFLQTAWGQGELSRPLLQGKWEGVMTGIGPAADGSPALVPPFDAARGQFGFRLDIRASNLVMYFQNGDQWVALGEGLDLRTNELGRTAVVIAALPFAQNGGTETMMLNIARWTEDSIAVQMSRVRGKGTGTELPPPVNAMGILNRQDF